MQQEILPGVAIVGSQHLLIPSQDVSELAKKMYGEIQTFKRFLRLQHGKALIHSSSYRTGRSGNSETIRYRQTFYGIVRYYIICYPQLYGTSPMHIAVIDKLDVMDNEPVERPDVIKRNLFVPVKRGGGAT